MKKNLFIDGKTFEVEISADLVRLYCLEFESDLFSDIKKTLAGDYSYIENLAFVMIKAANPEIGDIDSWRNGLIDPDTVIMAANEIIALWNNNLRTLCVSDAKSEENTRKQTSALFLLRACQLGLSINDLKLLTVGMVIDMLIEAGNDTVEYPKKATQRDIDTLLKR